MQSFYPAPGAARPAPVRQQLRQEQVPAIPWSAQIEELAPWPGGAARPPAPAAAWEAAVWRAACLVPRGRVSTYGALARAAGEGWDARSVGQALKRNPHAVIVPCHRVVRADRSLGGYFGGTDVRDPRMQAKIQLLREEGVIFDDGTDDGTLRVHPSSIWQFPDRPDLEAVHLPGEEPATDHLSLYSSNIQR